MNHSQILMEKVRATTPNKSKEQTAKALGMQTSTLRRIYKGKGYPNALNCLEISRILHIDLESVVAYIAADKARSDEARMQINKRLPRLLPAAGLALTCIAGGLIMNSGTSARTAREGTSAVNQAIHYAQRLRRFRRTWGSGLADIFKELAAAA